MRRRVRLRRRGLIALLGTVILAAECIAVMAQERSDVPHSLCYAFLKERDLYVNCGAKAERITAESDIADFAVAMDGAAVALVKEHGTEKSMDGHDIPRRDIELVMLKPGFQRRWLPRVEGSPGVEASCGTILAVWGGIWSRPSGGFKVDWTARDAFTGKEVRYDGYFDFVCSSDRKTVVGCINSDARILMSGVPPRLQVMEATANEIVIPYNISPNGKYVAYVANELCVASHERTLGCLQWSGTRPGEVSVSDSMGVLLDGGTGQTHRCFFNAAGQLSFKPLPGYSKEVECMGVALWRPGDKTAQVLEMFGWSPQWITPEAAAALCL